MYMYFLITGMGVQIVCIEDLLSKAVQTFNSERSSLEQKWQDGGEDISTESLPPASKQEPLGSLQDTSVTGEAGAQEEALPVEQEEEESLQQSTVVVSSQLLSQV